jgi:hypothetical protein
VTVCTTDTVEFASCKRRKVQANFGGGEITSDAGVMLLSQADKKLKLTLNKINSDVAITA